MICGEIGGTFSQLQRGEYAESPGGPPLPPKIATRIKIGYMVDFAHCSILVAMGFGRNGVRMVWIWAGLPGYFLGDFRGDLAGGGVVFRLESLWVLGVAALLCALRSIFVLSGGGLTSGSIISAWRASVEVCAWRTLFASIIKRVDL